MGYGMGGFGGIGALVLALVVLAIAVVAGPCSSPQYLTRQSRKRTCGRPALLKDLDAILYRQDRERDLPRYGRTRHRFALKAEGFGVLTEIDVKATMKKSSTSISGRYRILGARNPLLAHQALIADDKIGTMLPCNVIVQDIGGGQIEVAAINPAISMQHVGNPTLQTIADSVTGKLKRVIAAI